MGFMQDVLPIFKKRQLTFLESRKESADVYSFLFEKESGMTWKAGQHGLFQITHAKMKNPVRPITLASAPAEHAIRITTRIGNDPSEFKKALLELKAGMTVSMSGPVGSFYLKENRPALLIAGGIGVTPFRSMIRQLEAEGGGDAAHVRLLYLDSKQNYLFREEFEQAAARLSIFVSFLASRDDLRRGIDEFIASHKDNGSYFVSGPKSMVEEVSSAIQKQNISKRNIKKDVFIGY